MSERAAAHAAAPGRGREGGRGVGAAPGAAPLPAPARVTTWLACATGAEPSKLGAQRRGMRAGCGSQTS